MAHGNGVDRCPACNSENVDCVDSRSRDYGRYRRKRCADCNFRYKTMEIPYDVIAKSPMNKMRGALIHASNVFRLYERLHMEKKPPDENKAQRNAEMAVMCEDAIFNKESADDE